MDVDVIHAYLSRESYWASGVPRDVVLRALDNSLCFGVFDGEIQVALARVVTDKATFAYLCDVFVVPTHQGQGIGRILMDAIDTHPDLQGLRRWMLVTRSSPWLYEKYGFEPVARPETIMERVDPDIYARAERRP
jgi:GNAT superfamily N-acetyltransferase